jgi:hypothetical protein
MKNPHIIVMSAMGGFFVADAQERRGASAYPTPCPAP